MKKSNKMGLVKGEMAWLTFKAFPYAVNGRLMGNFTWQPWFIFECSSMTLSYSNWRSSWPQRRFRMHFSVICKSNWQKVIIWSQSYCPWELTRNVCARSRFYQPHQRTNPSSFQFYYSWKDSTEILTTWKWSEDWRSILRIMRQFTGRQSPVSGSAAQLAISFVVSPHDTGSM